jgi:predicted histone-like DNA-binding protein
MGLVNAPVLGINLKKNTNSNSAGYGKYYPEVARQKTLTTRGFAEHMISHGSKYGLEDIVAILRMFSTCLPELLSMGIGVKFDGLGCFLPYAQSKKGITKAQMAGITPQEIIKAIHIRFLPDSTKLDNLAGPKFADRCSMEMQNVIVVERRKDAQTGKVVEVLRTEIPINTFLSENYTGTTGSNTNNGGGDNNGNNGGGDNNGGGGGGEEGADQN